jgi:hypothetical protein
MPPKVKQGDTPPGAPPVSSPPPGTQLRSDQLNQLGPADPGNPNAPANPNPTPPQSGVSQVTDLTGTTYNVIPVTVGGVAVNLQLSQNVDAADPIGVPASGPGGFTSSPTVQQRLQEISTWSQNTTKRAQIVNQMYAAGLLSSKKAPSAREIALAWQLVVQEAALQSKLNINSDLSTPEAVLAKAAQQGWNAIGAQQAVGDTNLTTSGNINGAADTANQSETVYKSYVDPATAMGALADAYYRLMGRNPNAGEYQAFLTSIKGYQDTVNTGRDETVNKGPVTGAIDPATGLPVDQSGSTGVTPATGTNTQTNIVSQRGIGQRGIEFLAGQAAMANPEEAQYQAATTVFSAIIKALGAPGAAGESGPTITAP